MSWICEVTDAALTIAGNIQNVANEFKNEVSAESDYCGQFNEKYGEMELVYVDPNADLEEL